MQQAKKNRMSKIAAVSAGVVLGSVFLTATAAERPNLVIILADDLGYGSVGCNGAPKHLLATPNIDRLAREGVRFTDANTPSSVCSPTRYGLLTGRYCWRTAQKSGVVNPLDPLIVETSRTTLASLLGQAGYTTGVIGKWHLGFGTKPRAATDLSSPLKPGPLQVGFDSYFGIPQNHGEWWGIYVDNEAVWGLRSTNHVACAHPSYYGPEYMGFDAPQRDDWTDQTVLTDRAVAWIKQQSAAKPFFLYFASAAIHDPITPTKESQGTSGAGPYGDWIRDVDHSVGRIVTTLQEAGFGDNTLVIFTSDNGGCHLGGKPKQFPKVPAPYTHLTQVLWEAQEKGLKTNGDFKGGKAGIYQGGFRVPFLARWPGRIPAKSESKQMICLVDVMATIAELTDLPLPKPDVGAEDSFSFLPALLGRAAAETSRKTLVLHSLDGTYAVRKGPWKWIEGVPAHKKGSADFRGAEELYDLSKDPWEKSNVIAGHPDVVKELRAFLDWTRAKGGSRKKESTEEVR